MAGILGNIYNNERVLLLAFIKYTNIRCRHCTQNSICFGGKSNSLWDFCKFLNFNTATYLQNFVNI